MCLELHAAIVLFDWLQGIPYNGSRLDVTLALSKKELHNLKKKQDTANTTDNNKSDKRNLYLLREGGMYFYTVILHYL